MNSPIALATDVLLLIFSSLGIVVILFVAFFAFRVYRRASSFLDKAQSTTQVAGKVFSSGDHFLQAFRFFSATFGKSAKSSQSSEQSDRYSGSNPKSGKGNST